jgi:group I intron endonuclease
MNRNSLILISGQCNVFSTGFNACGTYGVSGLIQTESFKTPIYIGSAGDIKKRLVYEHISELSGNVHANKPLQNYFNKYGMENLVFFHLESCAKEDLLRTEQKYIDYYGIAKDGMAFNICPIAGKPPRDSEITIEQRAVRKKRKAMSEETKSKIRKSNIGKKRTLETRLRISEANKGEKNPMWSQTRSPETIKKFIEARSKEFMIMSPSGEIIKGKNLNAFAKENHLDPSDLRRVIKGEQLHCKQWRRAQSL